MQSYQTPRAVPGYQASYSQAPPPAGYKAPQIPEVYVLSDHANASIPHEVREQFQRDDKGRVLFFTAPPLNVDHSLTSDGRSLGHSARYLASKAKKEAMRAKRKAETVGSSERDAAAKKAKVDEERKFKHAVLALRDKALRALEDQLALTTKTEYEHVFNGRTKEGVASMLNTLTEAQKVTMQQHIERDAHAREREAKQRVTVTGMTTVLEEKI